MSNASARRRFESAWRLANDPGTTAGERKAAQAAMDRMSAKYDTSGWVASLNGQARQEQQAQPPPRQKQQQRQGEQQSAGRQGQQRARSSQQSQQSAWDNAWEKSYRRAEEQSRRAAGARGYQRQQQKQGQRRPSGFDEAVKDNRERVDEYERTGEWQAGWWDKWRPGGYGYHERHDKYAHNTPPPPPPPPEPQYTQEQLDRAYGRHNRTTWKERPQATELEIDLAFVVLVSTASLFLMSIILLAAGSWTLEYVVADPLAALGDVGRFIGFVWHRRDIVLQFCGGAAWILALRQISDGLRAAPGFLAWAAVGTLLFVGGHLIGPPL